MGRPLNKRNFGNAAVTSGLVEMLAWIPGDPAPITAYIKSQKGSHRYNVANAIGISTGTVHLVNGGTALQQGQANVTVTPYASGGSGAAATATLGVQSATIGTSAGTGSTANWYTPSEVLHLSNGTATAVSNLLIDSVTLGAIVGSGGPGYTVGDTFKWTYSAFPVPPIVTIASVTGNGNVSGLTITTAGVVTNTSVTNSLTFTSSVQTNSWATGATFTERWDLNQVSVNNHGNYSVAPANPAAVTGSAHGQGGNVNLVWEVSGLNISNGGSGYQAVVVSFGSGDAAAIGTVNAASSVSSLAITVPGNDYTNTAPTVSITPVGTVQYASTIKNRSVDTFSNNSYEWVNSETTPVDGQAKLQTS